MADKNTTLPQKAQKPPDVHMIKLLLLSNFMEEFKFAHNETNMVGNFMQIIVFSPIIQQKKILFTYIT